MTSLFPKTAVNFLVVKLGPNPSSDALVSRVAFRTRVHPATVNNDVATAATFHLSAASQQKFIFIDKYYYFKCNLDTVHLRY